MKTLRKYTNMALLLISSATIVPAFANPTVDEQEQVQQEEKLAKYKKSIRGRIVQYMQNHEGIVVTSYYSLLISMALVGKYDLCKNHKKLDTILSGFTMIMAMGFLPLEHFYDDEYQNE